MNVIQEIEKYKKNYAVNMVRLHGNKKEIRKIASIVEEVLEEVIKKIKLSKVDREIDVDISCKHEDVVSRMEECCIDCGAVNTYIYGWQRPKTLL